MDEFRPEERTGEPCDDAEPARCADVCNHLGTALRTVFQEALSQHPMPNQHVDLLLALRHKERDRMRRRFA